MVSVVDKIHHYQRNIENCGDSKTRLLHCITKLYSLPVTVQHLQETGIGRTVNGLRKYVGSVGDASKALVYKWKAMVAEEETSDGEDQCEISVPDTSKNSTLSSKPVESAEENVSSTQQESRHTHRHGESKSELSMKDNTKHPSKSKPEERHKHHEKSKHSSKYHSQNDQRTKDSKGDKDNLKRDKSHSSRKHSHSRNYNLENSSDKISEINEKYDKKRKLDDLSFLKKESKKSKLSNNKNDNEDENQTSILENDNLRKINTKDSSPTSSQIEIKNEQNIKQEKGCSQERLKINSSNIKLSETNIKVKDSSEKQRHKKEEPSSSKQDNMKKNTSHYSSKEISKSKHHSSSINDKDYIKHKIKHKEHMNKHREKKEINSDKGIDCNSGTSFAEALGMCTIPQSSKKRNNNLSNLNPSKSIKTEQTLSPIKNQKISVKIEPEDDVQPNPLPLLAPTIKLEPLSVDLASTLPEISPNYKPLPYINPVQRKEEIKATNNMFYIKNQRTKVYSGNKVGNTNVSTLYDMCIRVLIENIDALEFTGGVPYDILKPVLEHATADQLFMLEHYNPYLIEDTDALWQFHCTREFRTKQRQEMESWREMYLRCLDEREAKLKNITANIKQSIGNSGPARSTKLAYVDNIVKPPRNILKKQAKYGTANDVPASASSLKKKLTSNVETNVVIPGRLKTSTSGTIKRNKAPLMAKALQLIKTRYKIR